MSNVVVLNLPSLNKSILGKGNNHGQPRLKTVSQDLREYFVGIIAKTNGPKLADQFRILSI